MKVLAIAGLLFVLMAPAWGNEREVECMARVIDGESRNEPEDGMFAVAWSMHNRQMLNLPEYGGTDMCAIANKHTYTKSGKLIRQYDGVAVSTSDRMSFEYAKYIARMTLAGHGAPELPVTHFCSIVVNYNACSWHNKKLEEAGDIGGHRFYTDPRFPLLEEVAAR